MLKNKLFWLWFCWGFLSAIFVLCVTGLVFRSPIPLWLSGDVAFAVLVAIASERGYYSRIRRAGGTLGIVQSISHPKFAGMSAGYFVSVLILAGMVLGIHYIVIRVHAV